ncbi:MAG: hypothetical protein AAGC54_16460 [Cyanobacteria bacterium P01_F01_bin.4]
MKIVRIFPPVAQVGVVGVEGAAAPAMAILSSPMGNQHLSYK